MRKMSPETSQMRRSLSRFGTFLEAVVILVLLLSGVGFVFVNKMTDQLIPVTSLILLGIAVEVFALFIIGIYVYLRFLRER